MGHNKISRFFNPYQTEFFQGITKINFHFFYHFSTVRWCRYLKSFLVEDKNLFIMHIQCNGHWWQGFLGSQGISSYDIELTIPEYFREPDGRWFNIKMTSYQYRKSYCGDKTILRPSYLHNGISYTDKMTSLYGIKAQEGQNKTKGYILQNITWVSIGNKCFRHLCSSKLKSPK